MFSKNLEVSQISYGLARIAAVATIIVNVHCMALVVKTEFKFARFKLNIWLVG